MFRERGCHPAVGVWEFESGAHRRAQGQKHKHESSQKPVQGVDVTLREVWLRREGSRRGQTSEVTQKARLCLKQ